jgi:nondiscriminating glutamyl-tRNA synthetase
MIRTRFAPSPTGSLHVGNARIAILNWLFARHHAGVFILRIEDTDSERNVPGAEARIRSDLLWLGLDWDEGPEHGLHGPYRQSQRGPLYRRYADRLLADGAAYLCFCAASPAAPDSAQPEPDAVSDDDAPDWHAASHAGTVRGPRVRCECAALDVAAAAGRADREPAAVRFRVPDRIEITVDDVVRGTVRFGSQEIADFVLLRSDGRPTYNFAVVVDDIEMKISHVIRGGGHLSNTPRQVLLFDALDAPRPVFAHVPMVLGPDRQKLSKRHGASAMAEYRAEGYHPDALVNYLSLLSWSSETGEEVLTPAELIAQVTLERIGAADVVFDPVKLRWLSSKHIEQMPLDALVAALRPCIDGAQHDLDDDRLRAAVAATRTHLATFRDINDQLTHFFPPDGNAAAGSDEPVSAHGAGEGRHVVEAAARVLASLSEWTEDALRDAIQAIGREAGARGRALYEPLRLTLTGRAHGPPLSAVLYVQGRDRVLGRLVDC